MNSKKKYSLIQLDSEVSYDHSIREARPIGEILAMMEPSENIYWKEIFITRLVFGFQRHKI